MHLTMLRIIPGQIIKRRIPIVEFYPRYRPVGKDLIALPSLCVTCP